MCLLKFHVVWLGALFGMGFGPEARLVQQLMKELAIRISVCISMAPLAWQLMKELTIAICKGEPPGHEDLRQLQQIRLRN